MTESNTKNNYNNNTKNGPQEEVEEFKRIKIMDLSREVTRDHIEELCGKFGRINDIEMKRVKNGMISFVTFFFSS